MKVTRRFILKNGLVIKSGDSIVVGGELIHCLKDSDLEALVKARILEEFTPKIELTRDEILKFLSCQLDTEKKAISDLFCRFDKHLSTSVSNQIFLKGASLLLDSIHKDNLSDLKEVFYVHLTGKIRNIKVSIYPIEDLRKIAWFRTADEARMVLNLIP